LKSLDDSKATIASQQQDFHLFQNSLNEINKTLTNLQNHKIDEKQFNSFLQQTLKTIPTSSDLETLHHLINSLANDSQKELSRMYSDEILPLMKQNKEDKLLLEELIEKSKEPHVMCYGNDQSSRISALESRQMALELLVPPQSLEDFRQRFLGIEDQLRQIMKTIFNETLERKQFETNQKKERDVLEGSLSKELNLLDQKIQNWNENLKNEVGVKLNRSETERLIQEKLEYRMKQKEEEDRHVAAEAAAAARAAAASAAATGSASSVDFELLKEYCKELEKRVFLLANECRDGLEFVQTSQDKKIEILTKWILKNASSLAAGGAGGGGKNENGDGTDIGVKCLACNAPSSHVNHKTTVGGGFSFGANEKFGGDRHGHGQSTSPGRPGGGGGGSGGESAPFRVTVPESLRSLISKSREGRSSTLPPPATGAQGDYSSTQRLYDDLNDDDVSYEDIQRGNTTGARAGKGVTDRPQPNWKNSTFPPRPSSAGAAGRRFRR
jgi:hypothetical protein